MSAHGDDVSRAKGPRVTRDRPIVSCIQCRSKKRKCDRVYPSCGSCVKLGKGEACCWDARLFRSEEEEASRRLELRRRRRRKEKQLSTMEVGYSNLGKGDRWGSGFSGTDDPDDCRELERVNLSFTGVNRSWFEMVLRRFDEIERLYGSPPITYFDMHGLYDMWRHFLATDTATLQFRTETPLERRSLCNTFCALAAFIHASSNSSLNMASHTNHMARMALSTMDGLINTLEDEDDPELHIRIMRASIMVNRAINPYLKSQDDYNTITRFARQIETYLIDAPLTNEFPEVLSSRMMAMLHQGRVVEAVREAEGWRDQVMADPDLPQDNIKFRGFIMFVLLHNGLFLAVEKAYDPVYQMSHFNKVHFDGLSDEAQRAYVSNMNGMKKLYVMMPHVSDFSDPREQSAFERLKAFFMMWVAFSMFWTGDYSMPGDGNDDFNREKRVEMVLGIAEYAVRRILLGSEDRDPLNTPCWVSLMAGMHTLSSLAPKLYCEVLEESGCIENSKEKLSSRGRLVQGTLVEALGRMKVSR